MESDDREFCAKLANELKAYQIRTGHSQSEIARILGVNRQNVSAYMTGNTMPTALAFLNIQSKLGIQIDGVITEPPYVQLRLPIEPVILQSENLVVKMGPAKI